jgi:integrase
MKRAQRVWKLPSNPVMGIEKPAQRVRVEINVFPPEEIYALLRAAASEQDAAIYITAAFTGLRRGELVGLRWRDVDFQRQRVTASYTEAGLTSPKSAGVPRWAALQSRPHRFDSGRPARKAPGPAVPAVSGRGTPIAASRPRRYMTRAHLRRAHGASYQ